MPAIIEQQSKELAQLRKYLAKKYSLKGIHIARRIVKGLPVQNKQKDRGKKSGSTNHPLFTLAVKYLYVNKSNKIKNCIESCEYRRVIQKRT